MLLLLDLLDTDDDDLFLALSGGVEEPVVPGTGQFWSDGFWSAGFWADGFWGEAAEQLEALRRPKTNIRLRPIRDARCTFSGARAQSRTGSLYPKTSTPPALVTGRRVALQGASSTTRSVELLSVCSGAQVQASATKSVATSGSIFVRSGARARVVGGRAVARVKQCRCSAGAAVRVIPEYGAESFVGQVRPRAVQNPTDEQLAFLIATLRR